PREAVGVVLRHHVDGALVLLAVLAGLFAVVGLVDAIEALLRDRLLPQERLLAVGRQGARAVLGPRRRGEEGQGESYRAQAGSKQRERPAWHDGFLGGGATTGARP